MKNKNSQFAITLGEIVVTTEITETPQQVTLRLLSSIPGPIPDSPRFDAFLEETIAAYEQDPRLVLLIYNRLVVGRCFDEHGNKVLKAGVIRDDGGNDPGEAWKRG